MEADRDTRQKMMWLWANAAFGSKHTNNLPERGLRHIEEVIELCQALKVDKEQIHKLVDYVYARPPGNLVQEIGGVGLSLLVLCESAAVSADDAEQREIDRVMSFPFSHFKKRNEEKNEAGFQVVVSSSTNG